MATTPQIFTQFLSLLILLLHLGCFFFTYNHHSKKQKKISPFSPSFSPSPISLEPKSPFSFFKRLFSLSKSNPHKNPDPITPSPSSARSIHQSSLLLTPNSVPTRKTRPESDIFTDHQHFFPLRNDIYPCPACGEIFQSPSLLEQHQSVKHAVSELIDGDSGKNIVRIIFNTGWTDKVRSPDIIRILKIHNSSKILTRFEEYRECVKSKAARNGAVYRRDERCMADGNELLRFHCSTFVCDLGQNGNSSICNQQYCNVCGIIKGGFSPKLDGISTLSTSWRAHVAVPDGMEEEFKFMNLKRAMLVCRVIAGRVGCDPDMVSKEDPGYDSLVGRASGVHARLDEDDELLVFNPRAVLPCFVIVYTA
ncbi:hypothetical protein LguiB_031099 [Lonicera macranthoides]